MGCSVGGPSARGAEGVRGSADPLQEAVEGRAVAGAELGENGSVASGEEFLLLGHLRRGVRRTLLGDLEAIARATASV